MNLKKILYISLGSLCLALGGLGVCLPILPSTPFFLATLFFFSRSSDRLKNWFSGTRLYRRHLASCLRGEGMSFRSKIGLILSLSLLMGLGFLLMLRKGLWLPAGLLALVWLGHLYYIIFRVRTLVPESGSEKKAWENDDL